MRITNNMIMTSTKSNINGNKVNVDKYNTQMTTQQKISRASEDPVVAIRSLRLSTTLSHVDQYVDNNIPDANAWLDITYTALDNMMSLVTDIRTQCVNGSTDSLKAEDRATIQKNLEALQDQIYAEGNADYAGRTVFTGYRTDSNLTFDADEEVTRYTITEKFSSNDLSLHRYYQGEATVPAAAYTEEADGTKTYIADATGDISKESYYRLRMAYDKIDSLDPTINFSGFTTDIGDINQLTYEDEDAWMASGDYPLADDTVVFLSSTGELVMADNLAQEFLNLKDASISVDYQKTGFSEGDLRPEYYFDCTKATTDKDATKDPGDWDVIDGTSITYTLQDQTIDYTIANRTTLTINTQARDVFTHNIGRDVQEMLDAVNYANDAEEKVTKIKSMMESEKYSDDTSQEKLQTYLDLAQKEADYANDNLQKLYESYIGNFDTYLTNINTAITNVGSMQSRLELTQNRVTNQQTTVEELQSDNDNRDISDIIIDYYAANNAYTASLTAASKVGQQSLLNYL